MPRASKQPTVDPPYDPDFTIRPAVTKQRIMDALACWFRDSHHQHQSEFGDVYWADGWPVIWAPRAEAMIANEILMLGVFDEFCRRQHLVGTPAKALSMLGEKQPVPAPG